jgi:hypothetical protein
MQYILILNSPDISWASAFWLVVTNPSLDVTTHGSADTVCLQTVVFQYQFLLRGT